MLEDILVKFFNYDHTNIDKSYGMLIDLLYSLHQLGAINNVNEIVDYLDAIIRLEF